MGLTSGYTVVPPLYPIPVLGDVRVSLSHVWHLVQFFSQPLPGFETVVRLLIRVLLNHCRFKSLFYHLYLVCSNSVPKEAAEVFRGASRGQIAELNLDKGIRVTVPWHHVIRVFGLSMLLG